MANKTDPVVMAAELAAKAGKRVPSNTVSVPQQDAITKSNSNVVQLPLWGEGRRGFPNPVARSGLFNIRGNKTEREIYDDMEIETYTDQFKMSYTGTELRQDDADVFYQILHLARDCDLENEEHWIDFTAYSFLKALGRSTSGKDKYERLRKQIRRLKGNILAITINGKDTYGASMIRDFGHKEENGKVTMWRVRLEPRIVKLFTKNNYSLIEWELRKRLKSDLAKWLMSFYATHAQPYPIKVKTIHTLTKSTTKKLYSFKQVLQKALDELVQEGFLEAAWIDANDLVNVRRVLSLPALPAE